MLSQVPPQAYGYRLVLGVKPGSHEPVMAPEERAWDLMPFEAPSDLRLLSGHTYRIVWVDRQGEEVPPLEWAPAPALHFFLGEPDAAISAQQIESRYQAQTVMQLRRQVQELEEKLARAERKLRLQRKAMRKLKRRARDKIRHLRQLHKRDSVKTFISDWGPVVAVGAGLYLLARSRRAKVGDKPAMQRESPSVNAPEACEEEKTTVESEVPTAAQRIHPLRDSFKILAELIESEDSAPAEQELEQLATGELWSRIGGWLESASISKDTGLPSSSICSDWQSVHRVSAASSALALLSQALQEGEAGKSLSASSRSLLKASERFDERLRSWLQQRNLTAPLQLSDKKDLHTFSSDLANLLRDNRPEPGDTFGQVFHDALNATRMRLIGAVGEEAAATKRAEESDLTDILQDLALTHGPQVMQRAVWDLIGKWTGVNLSHSKRPGDGSERRARA